MTRRAVPCALWLLLVGCNVEARGVAPAGGDVDAELAVVLTDYQSTSVALLTAEGAVSTPLLIASSTRSSGLSAALSGDVVLPSGRPSNGVVLIDRDTNVLSWVDPTTAEVTRQLPVGTGFAANPQDYVHISADKAYVTRLDSNPSPGRNPFDQGGDVLIIDPERGRVIGRVDLAPTLAGVSPEFTPHPSAMVSARGRAFVLVAGYDQSFQRAAPTRLATIDTRDDALQGSVELERTFGWGSLSLSPSGERLAANCTGKIDQDPAGGYPDSAVFVFDVSDPDLAPRQLARLAPSQFAGQQIAYVEFATEFALVVSVHGQRDGASDAVFFVDLQDESATELLRADAPFVLGAADCVGGARCFVPDRERGAVRHFDVTNGATPHIESTYIDDGVGLPPEWVRPF